MSPKKQTTTVNQINPSFPKLLCDKVLKNKTETKRFLRLQSKIREITLSIATLFSSEMSFGYLPQTHFIIDPEQYCYVAHAGIKFVAILLPYLTSQMLFSYLVGGREKGIGTVHMLTLDYVPQFISVF